MKITVEWMDGETRTYGQVTKTVVEDGVLRIFGDSNAYGFTTKTISSIPLNNIREWRPEP